MRTADHTLLWRSASGYSPLAVAPRIVHDVLRTPGQPLPQRTRTSMEARFGADFSRVRVHADARAAQSAGAVNAMAYAVGRDVVFGSGQYAPGTDAGRRLLAHELTHVLQQGHVSQVPNPLGVGPRDDPMERQAEEVAAGGSQPTPTHTPPFLRRAAIHTGRILAEGTCEHLACNSKYMCEDNTNGVECPEGTRNAFSKTQKKFRPLFTCDLDCGKGKTCDDSDNWMALPKSRMKTKRGGPDFGKCGQDLVICANGKFTHGVVRDRSEKESWEVSPGILSTLGITAKEVDIKNGAVYADESDAGFKKDGRCRPKPAPPPKAPKSAPRAETSEAVEDTGEEPA